MGMEVDYHFGHKDGSGTEEGSMKIVREKRGGMWHTDIKTEAHPFSGTPIIPTRINNMEFEIESDRATKLKGKYMNPNMGRDIAWDIVRQPGKNIKAVIARGGVTSTIEGTLNKSGQDMEVVVKADIRGVKYDGKVSVKSAADKTKVDVLIKKGPQHPRGWSPQDDRCGPECQVGDSINRNLQWGSSSRRLSLDITGDAEFGAGPLASASPVQTEVKLTFDVDNTDLNGKFMKVYAGKEYS